LKLDIPLLGHKINFIDLVALMLPLIRLVEEKKFANATLWINNVFVDGHQWWIILMVFAKLFLQIWLFISTINFDTAKVISLRSG
jgi:hypothetical protein